jgi:hypothetical protein
MMKTKLISGMVTTLSDYEYFENKVSEFLNRPNVTYANVAFSTTETIQRGTKAYALITYSDSN